MKERIVVASGLKPNQLIKSMALHGINTMNLRIVNGAELARLMMMRNGISITEEFIGANEECAIIADCAKDVAYFNKMTYTDVQNLSSAIRRMRSLVSDIDEKASIHNLMEQGLFQDKNRAILNVYDNYIEHLKNNNLIDGISVIRKAISGCHESDAEFITLKEFPVTPLETQLISKVSNGTDTEISIYELYGVYEKMTSIESIKCCYGAANEAESIINDIYSGKPLDKCTVAVADPTIYNQLFFDYALLYDLPITFGTGIPIMNSNPAKLLVLYYRWITDGFFGAGAINAILSSDTFNKSVLMDEYGDIDENFPWKIFYKCVSDLRLTNNKSLNERIINRFKAALKKDEEEASETEEKAYKEISDKIKCIPFIEILSNELALSTVEFIEKYSYIRPYTDEKASALLNKIDRAALNVIAEELKVIGNVNVEQSMDDIILNILKNSVCKQKAEAGKLHLTDIRGAYSSVREHMFIAGLSSSKYPSSPKENYLLLDVDLKLFGDGASRYTSEGRIISKREFLTKLTRLSASLGSKVYLSYAGLNVSELKKENASSMIYELYNESLGKNASFEELEKYITKVDYFEPAISKNREIGRAYNKDINVKNSESEEKRDVFPVPLPLDKAYSPSAIEQFYNCPRSFLLNRVLGIPEPDEDRPFEIISAADTGTLAHAMMEKLANSNMTCEEFLKMSEENFDRFIDEHTPLIRENVAPSKAEFMDMMEMAYHMDPQREVVLKEEDIHAMTEAGVEIHGLPDRVEKLKDGSYRIVDYKTGRRIKHVENDFDTCFQVILYAYLMEQAGYRVYDCEYRYIRLGETVSCVYGEEMKDRLMEVLKQFKDNMIAGDFPLAEKSEDSDKDPCEYCKYADICGKLEDMDE